MREITVSDLDDIGAGASVLGTGGGGDPYIATLLAESSLAVTGPVPLVALEEIDDDAFVVLAAGSGSPTVLLEKFPSIDQVIAPARALATYLGRSITHIACAEVGGGNSMVPIVAAGQLGVPLIDADAIGRAFPEIQMTLPALNGVTSTPMVLADEKGNTVVLDTVDNQWGELLSRSVSIDMGCSAMVGCYAMTGKQARESLVAGSISLSADLGRVARVARDQHHDPVAAIVSRLRGRHLFDGKVVDTIRRTEGGLSRGETRLLGMHRYAGSELVLEFQNEYLIAVRDKVAQASVPDLICTVDAETGHAVTAERLRFGHRLSVFAAPADPRWHSAAGVELAGPRHFGYDLDPIRV
jgi:hypothetical protein